jgi:L-alanine-DL-glutamate epimerase-like enolase superfamily enzyme
VCEAASVHLLASIPNCLILEHLADDVPWRYELCTRLEPVDSHIAVPTAPGLGIEFNEEVALAHPGGPNVGHHSAAVVDQMYVGPRSRRRRLIQR